MDAMANYFRSLSPRERDELQIVGMVWNNSMWPREAAQIVEDCLQAGLAPEHFVRESHRQFWSWIVDAFQAGRPLGWESITAGKTYPPIWNVEICDIMINSPVAQSAVYHANHIIALAQAEAVARKATELASTVINRDPEEPSDVSELAAKTWDDLLAVKAVSAGRAVVLQESLLSATDEIEAAIRAKDAGDSLLIKTGLAAFDAKYGGLNRQGFHVLGARPGVGKTTVALNITLGAARTGSRVLYFTHEMSHTELTTKLISHGGGISSNRMRRGEMGGEGDMARFKKGVIDVRDLPIAIDDKSMPDWNSVERRIRQHAKSYKLSLVVIDYLQQLTCPGERWLSRVQELTHITGRIKALSQELRIAILGCAQLNRDAEKSVSGIPALSMLKDCGSLEQDADIVMFVHRGDENENQQLLVEKHRHDEAGIAFPLEMDLAFSRVSSSHDPHKIERRKKTQDSPVKMKNAKGRFSKTDDDDE